MTDLLWFLVEHAHAIALGCMAFVGVVAIAAALGVAGELLS